MASRRTTAPGSRERVRDASTTDRWKFRWCVGVFWIRTKGENHNKSDDVRRSDCARVKNDTLEKSIEWHFRVHCVEWANAPKSCLNIRNSVSRILQRKTGKKIKETNAHEIETQQAECAFFISFETWFATEHDSDIYGRNYSRMQCFVATATAAAVGNEGNEPFS